MRCFRAFTLIELAIVLVIIGLLVGLGAGMIGLLVKRAKYSETRERLEANVEALIGYALTHQGKLPRQNNCLQNLRNAKDAWGKNFICITANETTQHSACAIPTTSLQVVDDNDGQTHNNTAFVIISGGPNYNIQTSNSSPIHVYLPGAKNVDEYPADINRKESYDDLVRYVSLLELQAKLDCAHSENRLSILNNSLPEAYNGTYYNATVFVEGGVPPYRWCIEDPLGFGTNLRVNIRCNTSNPVRSSCNWNSSASWPSCDNVTLTSNSTISIARMVTNYPLHFFVQDSVGNRYEKIFDIPIH